MIPNDTGPIYKETLTGHPPIIEPFNTFSNLVFLAIVIYWAFKVYQDVKSHRFLAFAIPILFIGFVGGFVYHGTRSHEVWLLMDWVPIVVLSLAVSVHFQIKNGYKWWLIAFIMVAPFAMSSLVYSSGLPDSLKGAIGYSSMGLVILTPILHYLYKTHWVNARWVFIALSLFGLAIFFRTIENSSLDTLSMGTHFLWHTFGALASHFLVIYIFRTKGEILLKTP